MANLTYYCWINKGGLIKHSSLAKRVAIIIKLFKLKSMAKTLRKRQALFCLCHQHKSRCQWHQNSKFEMTTARLTILKYRHKSCAWSPVHIIAKLTQVPRELLQKIRLQHDERKLHMDQNLLSLFHILETERRRGIRHMKLLLLVSCQQLWAQCTHMLITLISTLLSQSS